MSDPGDFGLPTSFRAKAKGGKKSRPKPQVDQGNLSRVFSLTAGDQRGLGRSSASVSLLQQPHDNDDEVDDISGAGSGSGASSTSSAPAAAAGDVSSDILEAESIAKQILAQADLNGGADWDELGEGDAGDDDGQEERYFEGDRPVRCLCCASNLCV